MKYKNINFHFLKALFFALIIGMSSCEIDELEDPNNPSLSDILNGASLSELQNLVSGIESGMRNRLGTYYDGVGVIGREFYRFSGSDPRFTGDLLGKGSSTIDNNTFYTTGPFGQRYSVIKNCNILIEAIPNTSASLTTAEINDLIGWAKTIQAYQFIMLINQQYENGLRFDVADPENLGARVEGYQASLANINTLLDDAAALLTGSEFAVTLTTGYSTPTEFLKVNRAFDARVAVYRQAYSEALTSLSGSFYNISGSLTAGPNHIFSTAGGDATNPLFFTRNASGETRVAHPSFVTDAETGDSRLSKVALRDATASLDDLSSNYDVWTHTSNDAPISIIRNEELILINAEANIQLGNLADGVTALNVVRNAAGLADYSGTVDQASLIDEMLNQRRYSLFGEGHRWVDMRRYDRLSQLPTDRAEDDVFDRFPIPLTESN